MPDETCSTCKHAQEDTDGTMTCHKHAPNAMPGTGSLDWRWAKVDPDQEACGDYLPRPAA